MENTNISRRNLIAGAAALTIIAPAARAEAPRPFEVWLVRHGESQINVAHERKPGTPIERDDGVRFPLTVKGIEQVKALGARLEGTKPSAIFASTRLRAIQTADAISMATLVPIVPAPELVEVDVGTPGSPAGAATDFQQVYRRWLAEGDVDARMPGGESRAEVEARAVPFIRAMIEQYRPLGGPLIFVAHGALIAITAPHIFDNVDHRFAFAHPITNTGMVRGALRDGKLRCTHWSGTDL